MRCGVCKFGKSRIVLVCVCVFGSVDVYDHSIYCRLLLMVVVVMVVVIA